MAIIPYEINGQTCYKIRAVSKSKIRKQASAQKESDLGAVSLKEASTEYKALKRQTESLRLEREKNQMTWRQLLNIWFQKDVMTCTIPTTTKKDNYNSLLMHTKIWMDTPVDKLTQLSVEMIFSDMTKAGLSYGRLKSIKGSINGLCKWAVLNHQLPINFLSPAKGAIIPKVATVKQPILNQNEIRIFLRKAKEYEHEYYPVWATAMSTGCRSGELFALQWKDIDFENKILNLKSDQTIFNCINNQTHPAFYL